ncbi:hypothetical protein, partial [uncultured Ruminococcus sp.]|uniref:hypothetical protein n=1 Tax=uncultured Ruminococcus sp. TaxID=165186 RepID=UPI002803E99B
SVAVVPVATDTGLVVSADTAAGLRDNKTAAAETPAAPIKTFQNFCMKSFLSHLKTAGSVFGLIAKPAKRDKTPQKQVLLLLYGKGAFLSRIGFRCACRKNLHFFKKTVHHEP